MSKKWEEVIKSKKRIVFYGEQVLSNGNRLRWKGSVKNRRIHHGITEGMCIYVNYLCGKRIHHNRAIFTDRLNSITCPYCIELLQQNHLHCPNCGFIEDDFITNNNRCKTCDSLLMED